MNFQSNVGPSDEVNFKCGLTMKNRFMLAPLTNHQSFDDGKLSDEEFDWLVLRAKGYFGITMTCASHVSENGRGFPGQLGVFDDFQLEGLSRLSKAIKEESSLSMMQLHHAGMRSPSELIGTVPISPSGDTKIGSRAMSIEEVELLRDDFISAAKRAQKAGFDGVEIHGAHGYMICQFLSSRTNARTDIYGGSFKNRIRILLEIIQGIRISCGNNFLLGLRLSPERFGLKLQEIKSLCELLIEDGAIDFLDMSLWDSFKLPNELDYKDKDLLSHFADLDRGHIKLTVAGKIMTSDDVYKVLDAGVDFVTIGRAGILHYDYPNRVINESDFVPVTLPVSREYLAAQALSPKFISYMDSWDGFVEY